MTIPRRLLIMALALAFAPACFAQTTNAPQFIRAIRASADSPVVIEWQSQPSAVYAVEYSAHLNNGWQQVETEFPAQGTTTRWTDRGNPVADGFRLSSGDAWAPQRFYRLKVERLMDTTLPITVSITGPASGATLTGEVLVQGSASASQGIASIKLLVDGHVVGRARGPNFSLPLETRFFANGSHRISVVAQDIGAIESTEEANSFSSRGASYGAQNIDVTFDNVLTDVRLRYEHFRPEFGWTQQVFAVWSTHRNWGVDVTSRDGSTIYRSFSGTSQRVAVDWDGRDAANQMLSPQVLRYVFHDLGPAPEPPPGGGISGAPPGPNGGMSQAVAAGASSYFTQPPPMPPVKLNGQFVPWEQVYGPMPMTEVKIPDYLRDSILASFSNQSLETVQSGLAQVAQDDFAIFGPYSLIGTVAIAGQGHHPSFGSYPTPPRTFGRVRMSSVNQFGPWGPLKRVAEIVNGTATTFTTLGYSVLHKELDDQVQPNDILQDSFGGPNIFNQANVGLFVGHSVAARDAESGQIVRQSYIPIYNKLANSMTFVGSGSMNFGSDQLKWMAFFTCNMFRSELYRSDGVYDEQKNFFTLPMNGNLHIMQGYATEMSVHPDFPFWWGLALRQSPLTSPLDQSVIGAWNYVCRNTQPTPTPNDPVNVARSVFWPECEGDFIYGYGPQTDPFRDPEDPTEQADLSENDHPADSPDP